MQYAMIVSLGSHPVLHYLMEFVCYNVGLLVNVLTAAHLSTASKNSGVQSVKQYFALRWIPLATRWTVCIFLFLMVWENPALSVNTKVESILGGSILPHMGASGFLGFGCDHLMGQITALLGMQRELPPIPPAPDPGPNPTA